MGLGSSDPFDPLPSVSTSQASICSHYPLPSKFHHHWNRIHGDYHNSWSDHVWEGSWHVSCGQVFFLIVEDSVYTFLSLQALWNPTLAAPKHKDSIFRCTRITPDHFSLFKRFSLSTSGILTKPIIYIILLYLWAISKYSTRTPKAGGQKCGQDERTLVSFKRSQKSTRP